MFLEEIISQLHEPLTIRGYFSARTHPLLAPLVPQVKDMLREYQTVSDNVRVVIMDPRDDPAVEAEANKKYDIKPVPFQISDRHSASMVNSYFNVVVEYGDQHEVFGFPEVIEIQHDGFKNIELRLRDLEYNVDSAILKVFKSFNRTDNLFAGLKNKIKFVGYVSPKTLPENLKTLLSEVKSSVKEYEQDSQGKMEVEFLDPSEDRELATRIASEYGFKPQMMSLFAEETFYFYLTIVDENKIYSLGVPSDLSADGFKKDLDAALKRLTPGFLRSIGVVAPSPMGNPMMAQFGGGGGGGKQFKAIQQKLGENYNVKNIDLDSGNIDNSIDTLLVIAPKDLTEKQIFAIDQALMRGMTVTLVTSGVSVNKGRQGFSSQNHDSGLNEWLNFHGINIPRELVLDESNTGVPIVRRRVVRGVTINEPVMVSYPFFIDVRRDGFGDKNPISAGIGQVNMAWASPVIIDEQKNKERKVTPIARSSQNSWRSTDTSVEANHDLYPELGFVVGDKKEPSLLAAAVEGKFTSFFAGKKSPLIEAKEEGVSKSSEGDEKKEEKVGTVTSVIEKSTDSAKIIFFLFLT